MVTGQAMAEFDQLLPTLLELGLSNPIALQEVQARQVIYGGDLQLNLLELGVVSEQDLLSVLAQISQLPACPPGPVLLDLDLTIRLRSSGVSAVAGAREDGVVIVAVPIALPITKEQVSELLGEPCEIMLTTTLRLQEALYMFNGEDLPKRLAQLIDKLGKRLSLSQIDDVPRDEPHVAQQVPGMLPPVVPVAQPAADVLEPAPVETKSLTRPETHGQLDDTAPPPHGYQDVAALSAIPSSIAAPSARPRDHYNLKDAEHDLSTATTRERLVDVLLRFCACHFQYVAAFAVAGNEARGLTSVGHGSAPEQIKGLVVPLDLAGAFKTAVTSERGYLGRLRASGVEGGVARDLGRPVGLNVLLQSIFLQQRPVLLLWCDSGMSTIAPSERSALEQIAPHVISGLKRVLMERKRATQGPQLNAPPVQLRAARASRPAVAPALASSAPAAAAPPSPAAAPAEPSPAPAGVEHPTSKSERPGAEIVPPPAVMHGSDRVAVQVSEREDAGALRSRPTKIGLASLTRGRLLNSTAEAEAATRRNSAAPPPNSLPPAGTSATHEVAAPPRRPLAQPDATAERVTPTSDPPQSFPPEPARTLKGFPASQRPENFAAVPTFEQSLRDPRERAPLASRRIVALGRHLDSEEPPHPGLAEPDLDEVEISTTGTMLSRRPFLPDEDLTNERDLDSPKPDLSPELQQLKRPKSFTSLVAELLEGNESVLPQILDGGETAVGALIAEFPGPVTEPSSPSQRGSECGPILSALVGLGSKSIPFITVRTADENPRVRRWATFLLGELPGKDSAKAVASRLLDSSIEVRRAALASARRMRRDALTRRTLRAHVEQICRDQGLDADARCSAIEALADIREHESIPVLLQLLEDFSPNVTRSARWALCVLTRQDFGDDLDAWRQFWQHHRDEDRVEWLIASLDHERRDIRRAAGDELRALCGKDFGYDEEQSQSDRRKAQADFRSWWHETGKANLH